MSNVRTSLLSAVPLVALCAYSAGSAQAGYTETDGANFIGTWSTTWQSPTGSYDSPLQLSGATAAGTVTGHYDNGTVSGSVSPHLVGGKRDGWTFDGKWTRTNGSSGGSCSYGRFHLLLTNPAVLNASSTSAKVADVTFSGKWTYCDADPTKDANSQQWTGNQPQNISFDGYTLPVPLYPQLTNMWCWAASSEMVVKYLFPSIDIKQADEANTQSGRSDCGKDPTPGPVGDDPRCVVGGFEVFGKYGVKFSHLDQDGNFSSKADPDVSPPDPSRTVLYVNGAGKGALSWDQLRSKINAGQPVMYAWAWKEHGSLKGDRYISGGHMMVVRGWATAGGEKFVYINNPWVPQEGAEQILTYDHWVGGLDDDHVHWKDYYDFKYDGSSLVAANGVGGSAPASSSRQATDATVARRAAVAIDAPRILLAAVPSTATIAARPLANLLPPTQVDAIRAESRRASQILRSFTITPDVQSVLGLRSPSDASSATLGQGIHEYTLSPGALAHYDRSTKVEALLQRPANILFPITVQGQLRSAVRIGAIEAAPRVTSFEQLGVIGRIAQIVPLNTGDAAVSTIRIPAFGLYFVARTVNGELQVASIFDAPELKLRKGEFEPGSVVLERLSPYSNRWNKAPS